MSHIYHEKISQLLQHIRGKKGILVAFSGGVDSSVVATLAYKALGDKSLAVTVDSPLLPPRELEEALGVAKKIGIRHRIVKLNELEAPGFVENPPDRCYRCKKFRLGALKEIASGEGIGVIADGTNLSDFDEHRPGIRAALESGIYSPLVDMGLRKDDVREVAKVLGLPVAEKPASPCLATRIPYGSIITEDRLRRISESETFIQGLLQVKILRVRDYGNLARIEVARHNRRLFFDEEALDSIVHKLKSLGYCYVTIDLEGYRSGSMDEVLKG